MIAFVDNLHPLRLRKTAYWNRPEFQGRYHPNPYYRKLSRAAFGTSAKALWGRIVYFAAWWLTPHPMAALLLLWFAVLYAGLDRIA